MIKIDLITGFLGSGKTTFIHSYVPYLISLGYKVGIVENDFGAINIDRMLLNDLESDNCIVEQVIGDNILDYKRRFKTKLIALKMQGVNYVVVEPSGIYDNEMFFDVLDDDTLHSWYQINNIITLISLDLIDENLTREMRYLIANQLSYSGNAILTKLDNHLPADISKIKDLLNDIFNEFNLDKNLDRLLISHQLNNLDYQKISQTEYTTSTLNHLNINLNSTFKNVFLMNLKIDKNTLVTKINEIFNRSRYGLLLRVKGYLKEDDHYLLINAVKEHIEIDISNQGQEVIIFIGQNLNEALIKESFNG